MLQASHTALPLARTQANQSGVWKLKRSFGHPNRTSIPTALRVFLQVDIRCPTRGSHAETAIKSHERERLEKLVRYMARPAISDERLIIEGPQAAHRIFKVEFEY